MSLLRIEGLSVSFAGLKALSGVDLEVQEGEILGLIGPNGAGKTTLLNCISRLYTPTAGSATFAGSNLLGVPMHRIAELGIARTFQNLEVNKNASVLENVTMGCVWRHRSPLFAELLALPSAHREQSEARRRAMYTLDSLSLAEFANERIGSLPFGTQKNIELARAMASEPRLLLLDEPAAGLNPDESTGLGTQVRKLRDQHRVAVVLIEHDMTLVMESCDRIVVLDHGVKIADGTPRDVRENQAVRDAYLGCGEEDA
jgi:branched-chain amino acid transport system ATP-binding protein